MCGIIGIASNKPVSSAIINSLRKLEYRGYDSSGIATLSEGILNEAKSEGRVDILEKNIAESITNKQKIENLKKDLFEANKKFIQAEKYLEDLKKKLKNITI